MIERQAIITWYTMDEKKPPEDTDMLVTFSGKLGHVTYEHVLAIGMWDAYEGWVINGIPEDAEITVHAWADIEPYGG